MIRDRNIDWQRKRRFYSVMNNGSFITASTATLASVSTNAPIMADINSLALVGALMPADEEVDFNMMVPYDADPDDEMGFKIHWTCDSATTTESSSWIVLADFRAINVATAMVKGVTALDTVVPLLDLVIGAAYAPQSTARGIKNKSWLTRAQVEAGAWMSVNVECSAETVTTNVWMLGLEIDYKVRATNS